MHHSIVILKRDGRKQRFIPEKITSRVKRLLYGLPKCVSAELIKNKVLEDLGCEFQKDSESQATASTTASQEPLVISTAQLDDLAAEKAHYLQSSHPAFEVLASRIVVNNLHKQTEKMFSKVIRRLYEHQVKTVSGEAVPTPLVSQEVYDFVMKHAETLDSHILHDRDYSYDMRAITMLSRSYLWKIDGSVVERPQHALMRVAVALWAPNLENVLKSYDYQSSKVFTHPTPTLHSAGSKNCNFSSCFLVSAKEDSIEGMYETTRQLALISRAQGGIGLSLSNIRADGSYIRGCNAHSTGVLPWMRVLNGVARHVNQGGKRKGAIAIYMEPWHADIFAFLDSREQQGSTELRCHDLFTALWVPDEFMRRVEANEMWTLMCPNECPGLVESYGEKFTELYKEYETKLLAASGSDEKTKKTNTVPLKRASGKRIPAKRLWERILQSQIQTGTPYMLYKDACNAKSNQKHLGTIRSSNLCTEIVQYSSKDEIAVCNLASLSLPAFVVPVETIALADRDPAAFVSESNKLTFDFRAFSKAVEFLTRSVNQVIDRTSYPLPECKTSNLRHRPMALGVQGLAEVLIKLRLCWTDQQTTHLNYQIFEVLYYSALRASMQLAQEQGPYESFAGSPASQGILQFDMWKSFVHQHYAIKTLCKWDQLKADIRRHGLRNSLLVGPMPTVSTSQLLGNTDSFEPTESNMYLHRTLAGDVPVFRKELLYDLLAMDLLTRRSIDSIINEGGSVSALELKGPVDPKRKAELDRLKELYKTVWEVPMKCKLQLAIDRAPFIDQSQSLNIALPLKHMKLADLEMVHFKGWRGGLKTGSYYIRTQPVRDPIKFSLWKSMLDEKAMFQVQSSDQQRVHKVKRQASRSPSSARLATDSETEVSRNSNSGSFMSPQQSGNVMPSQQHANVMSRQRTSAAMDMAQTKNEQQKEAKSQRSPVDEKTQTVLEASNKAKKTKANFLSLFQDIPTTSATNGGGCDSCSG